MGTLFRDRGSMNDSSTPVCEKGNGPSNLRQFQRCGDCTPAGILDVGHTTESSSGVRVIDVNSPFSAQSGTTALGSSRTIAYGAGIRRKRSRRPFFLSEVFISIDAEAELCSARPGLRPGPTSFYPSAALRTAAFASKRVESITGNGDDSAVTRSGISVHPSTTASQP